MAHRLMRRRLAHGHSRHFGPGRRGMIEEFLADNPECASKLARYGVDQMRDMGFDENEVRSLVEHMNRDGLLSDADISAILET